MSIDTIATSGTVLRYEQGASRFAPFDPHYFWAVVFIPDSTDDAEESLQLSFLAEGAKKTTVLHKAIMQGAAAHDGYDRARRLGIAANEKNVSEYFPAGVHRIHFKTTSKGMYIDGAVKHKWVESQQYVIQK